MVCFEGLGFWRSRPKILKSEKLRGVGAVFGGFGVLKVGV